MRPGANFGGVALVLLRTVIGWHFLYEGWYKLMLPAWGRGGSPIGEWSAAGYLHAASGPLAAWVRPLADSGAAAWIDLFVPLGLLLVGLSLMLGLFTQAGCWGALAFLTLFYVTAIPTQGIPQPGQEGTYLLVNKTLVEWAAVLVVLAFRTGQIAGLDVLLRARRTRPERAAPIQPAVEPIARS
jgi:thiosulfate dehydrogenase (quinone) large subunit